MVVRIISTGILLLMIVSGCETQRKEAASEPSSSVPVGGTYSSIEKSGGGTSESITFVATKGDEIVIASHHRYVIRGKLSGRGITIKSKEGVGDSKGTIADDGTINIVTGPDACHTPVPPERGCGSVVLTRVGAVRPLCTDVLFNEPFEYKRGASHSDSEVKAALELKIMGCLGMSVADAQRCEKDVGRTPGPELWGCLLKNVSK